MIEYVKGEGWILTGEDKIDLFSGEEKQEKILHALEYPAVDTAKYTDYYFDAEDGYDDYGYDEGGAALRKRESRR